MAYPVAYANSPAPGSVAWDAFSIQYQGETFSIPAGNTTQRFVWWRWNGGGAASVIEAGPDLPDGTPVYTDNFSTDPFASPARMAHLHSAPNINWDSSTGSMLYSGTTSDRYVVASAYARTPIIEMDVDISNIADPSGRKVHGVFLHTVDTFGTATAARTGILIRSVDNAWTLNTVSNGSITGRTTYRTLHENVQIAQGETKTVKVRHDVSTGAGILWVAGKKVMSWTLDMTLIGSPSGVRPGFHAWASGGTHTIRFDNLKVLNSIPLTEDDLIFLGNKNGTYTRPHLARIIDGDLLVSGSVLTEALGANSVTTDKLDANAINAKHTLTGPLYQTTALANRGIKIDSTGLIGYNSSGSPTIGIDATTGSVYMLGEIRAGSTITGAKVQTTATASRGIELTTSALLAYDANGVTTFAINAANGDVSFLGKMRSGSELAGATITGALSVVGGRLETNATAARGVKITDAGLDAYDVAGVVTFQINGATGDVTMRGSLTSGSSIVGATVTGSTIQTVTAANEGIKLDSSGLRAYRSGMSTPIFEIPTTGQFAGMVSINNDFGLAINSKMNLINGDAQLIALDTAVDANNMSVYTSLSAGALTTGYWDRNQPFPQNPTNPSIKTSPTGIDFKRANGTTSRIALNEGNLQLYLDSSVGARLRGQNGNVDIEQQGTGNLTMSASGNMTLSSSGPMVLGTPSGGVVASQKVRDSTASGTANMLINATSGVMYRLTSSRRYKTSIRPWSKNNIEHLLDLVPATWYDIAELERWENGEEYAIEPRRYFGLIAEEVHEAGLYYLVNYNEDGQPDSLNYDRIGAMSLPLLRQLFNEVAELRAAKEAQDQKIATLEELVEGMAERLAAVELSIGSE